LTKLNVTQQNKFTGNDVTQTITKQLRVKIALKRSNTNLLWRCLIISLMIFWKYLCY